MANNLTSNTAEKLLKKFTANFMSDTVLFQTCGREIVNDYDASTGGVVKMKRPTRYVPQLTADGDLTGGDINPISVGSVLGEVGQYITILVKTKDIERALELDQLGDGTPNMDTLLGSAATDMSVELETQLGKRMMDAAALSSGSIDTPITQWSNIADSGALLHEIGAPKGNMYSAVSSYTETALADANTALGVNPQVGDALASAMIRGKYAGFESVLRTNNLPSKTHGTESNATLTVAAAPLQTYAAAKDSMQMTLSLSGGDAGGTIVAGQQLRFTTKYLTNMRNHKTVINQSGAEEGFTVTVLADATADGSGNYTLSVSGAAIFETGVDGAFNNISELIAISDVATVLGTADKSYRPALSYCGRDFFGCGSVKLDPLPNMISKVINMPDQGLSIRVSMDSAILANSSYVRFDLLPTFACYNPFLGVQVGG